MKKTEEEVKQIIFVVETDKKANTDNRYIREVFECFCAWKGETLVKPQFVYMGGKGNYKCRKVNSSINQFQSLLPKKNSKVIYCFDTDRFDSDPNENSALLERKRYCLGKNFGFVWFCHDIEEVFHGERCSSDKEKINLAKKFSCGGILSASLIEKLSAKTEFLVKRSNLFLVLSDIFAEFRKA